MSEECPCFNCRVIKKVGFDNWRMINALKKGDNTEHGLTADDVAADLKMARAHVSMRLNNLVVAECVIYKRVGRRVYFKNNYETLPK